ncbi:hypothetical protein OAS39_02225 [Pirellulales bacterium]|nr:hypothetical protein [Pirellulales bacterium]
MSPRVQDSEEPDPGFEVFPFRGPIEDGQGKQGRPVCYLKYILDRCFVKAWSTSGDADDRPTEEVAFYYNKIAFCYAATPDGLKWDHTHLPMGWDNTSHTTWDLKFQFDDTCGGWWAPGSANCKKLKKNVGGMRGAESAA